MPHLPDMVALVGWGGTPHRSTNPHSFQWTHVMRKSRNNADISEEELLKIFNQKAKRAKIQWSLPGCIIRAPLCLKSYKSPDPQVISLCGDLVRVAGFTYFLTSKDNLVC